MANVSNRKVMTRYALDRNLGTEPNYNDKAPRNLIRMTIAKKIFNKITAVCFIWKL